MWRSARYSTAGTVCVQQRLIQGRAGLLRVTGLPIIQGTQALASRSLRCVAHIARSSYDQNAEVGNGAAGALVPTPQQNGNLPAAPTAGGAKVPVQFVVPEYLTHWGQVLKVVGSLEELGSWKVEKAPSMQWNEGHTWTLDVQLPVGAVNFKIVMHDQPNSHTRWEIGEDRSVLIPETTTVTGAPVGQVGVTCDFNDVHNSRVEVRPDRAYLKQQLKAVEARVMAIQEKKRKLDQNMSVLTNGLKKYDATVALLQNGVQAAVEERRSSKEAAAQQQLEPQQQQQPRLQQPVLTQPEPASSNGVPVSKQQSPAASPARVDPLGRTASIQVPILDPSELPAFGNVAAADQGPATPAALAAAEAAAAALQAAGTPDNTQEAQQPASQDAAAETAFEGAAMATASDSSSGVDLAPSYGAAPPDVSAIKASHVNETVLSATVDQLLAAAEDALARSSSPSEPLPVLSLGSTGVDDVQLAEEYVEELLAAASALEQQADRRASLLLEAAKHTGDSDMAADIEQLAAAELPPIPTVEELADADAAAAAVDASLQDDTGAEAPPPAAAVDAVQEETQQQQVVVPAAEQAQQQQEVKQQRPMSPASAAAQQLERDGSITFSAESLKGDVDVQQLLAAVLSRVGIPLRGQVTISATYIPSTPPAAGEDISATAAAADVLESAAEASLDHNVDSMAAAAEGRTEVHSTPAAAELEQQAAGPVDQPQQQQQEVKRSPLSPVEAIAAVFSRGSSMDSEDEGGDTTTASSNNNTTYAASNGRGLGFHSGGSSSSSGNGVKQQPAGSSRYSRTAAPSAADAPAARAASTATAAAAGGAARAAVSRAGQRVSMLLDSQEAARQLEAKEAARRAAAERVAAALAQVEEMRRSVVAANSMLKQQLHGDDGTDSSSRTSSSSTFSKYRVVRSKGQHHAPAAAGSPPASSNGTGMAQQQQASDSSSARPTPVSSPGSSRGLPAIGATAVAPSQAVWGDGSAASGGWQGPAAGGGVSSGEVQGEVREELSLLAALASEVAKQARSRGQ